MITYDSQVLNLDTPAARTELRAAVSQSEGLCVVTLKPYRGHRSNAQNAYWWAEPVLRFQLWLHDSGYNFDKLEAHRMIVLKVCKRVDVVNHETGEVIDTVAAETKKMNTAEFSRLIDDGRAWLATLGIVTQDPIPWYAALERHHEKVKGTKNKEKTDERPTDDKTE